MVVEMNTPAQCDINFPSIQEMFIQLNIISDQFVVVTIAVLVINAITVITISG